MSSLNKTERARKILSIFFLATLIASIFFVSLKLFVFPNLALRGPIVSSNQSQSEYVLMLVQCILGLIVFQLPNLLKRKFKIILPDTMIILYLVFLFAAIYLGEVKSFYYNIPQWDTILHTFSGAMLGAVGFSLINILNEADVVDMKLSPIFVALFAMCFAISCGVFWEMYEYTVDGLFNVNAQKYMLDNGTMLVGHAAISDTMHDLMVDVLGAAVMATVGFFSIKKKSGFLKKFDLKKAEEDKDENPDSEKTKEKA